MAVFTRLLPARRIRDRLGRLLLLAALAGATSTLTGCATWKSWHPFKPTPPPGPVESLVLTGDRLEPERQVAKAETATDLAGAHELYRQGDYAKAGKLFEIVADDTKNIVQVAEEARFYQAECYRRQADYPKAASTYNKLLTDFPSTQYREQATQHMDEIAEYWLEDTRKEMEETKERREGKRWVVWPHFVHFDKSKPVLDEEGNALEVLQQVQYNDIRGPLADRALFLAGSVHFFNENYKEADHCFTQLVDMHPNSPYAVDAIELGIIAKHMSTGGSDYDGRKTAEARGLVDRALRSYPELAAKRGDFLQRQLIGINLQQAEKDYKIAEFYRRTGHPGSAYFYYEIVRRRYPGTKFFDQATQHMIDLRGELEKSHTKAAPPPSVPKPEQQAPAPRPPATPGTSPTMTPAPRQLPPGLER
jgi:outer membrane protein assembly factor BamD (BamD/ComL family)